MSLPEDRRYAESHEWCKLDAGEAVVGLTQFAADQLTDITFVELPSPGDAVTAGEPCGEIESVKSASDINAPVTGEVISINPAIADEPGLVNREPFGAGWLMRIRPSDTSEMDSLMDANGYQAITGE